MRTQTIGQIAKAAGVTVDTVRYYERIGLIPRAPRSAKSWRRYSDLALVRLRYIREGRSVGFSIKEMRSLFEQTVGGSPGFCVAFDTAVIEKIRALNSMIDTLNGQRARLEAWHDACQQRRIERRCPILENLKMTIPSAR